MENSLRADLINWLRGAPELAQINSIEEERPLRASPPWLGFATSASTGWGTKDRPGREVRIALELETRSDDPAANASLLAALEKRALDLPPFAQAYELASVRFLRGRSEQRANNRRGTLLEFQFRLFSPITE